MGKASRRKDSRGTVDRRVRRFLDHAGVSRIPLSRRLWSVLGEHFGPDYVARRDDVLAARAYGDTDADPYSLLWQSLETARATYGMVAALTEAWLSWVAQHAPPTLRVLDVGCGIGVHTCFYASQNPAAEVIGVDRSPLAIERATELAAELRLGNVTFTKVDADALSADEFGLFDLVTASTFLADADPAGFYQSPSDPWSIQQSCADALAGGYLRLINRIADLLTDRGVYLGVERAGDAVSAARWLGAISNAGMAADTAALAKIEADGERLPAALARRGGEVDHDKLQGWLSRSYRDAFAAEHRIERDPVSQRIRGVEVDVADAHGHGRTRSQVLVLASGAHVHYLATTRGFRRLIDFGQKAHEAIAAHDHFVASARSDPAVFRVVDIL